MTTSRAIRWLHRWLGLACGAVLAAVALSGVVLVFQWPLLRALHPVLDAAPPLAAERAAAVIPRILDDWSAKGLRAVDFPKDDLPVWQLYFEDGARRYLAPASGEFLLERTADNDALLWLRELHVHLLAGETGEQVLGAIGFATLFLLISGLWRWWPGWRRVKASLVLRSHPASARWFTWHRAAGAIVFPVSLVLVVTGTAMLYGGPTRAALRALFGDGPDVVAPAPIPRSQAHRDWLAAIAAAQSALPDARLARFSVPQPGSDLVSIRARADGEWHPVGRSLIWIDLGSARVVKVHDARSQGLGTRINEAIYPVHGAFVGGAPWTIASVVSGVSLAFLFVSGLLFWLSRRWRQGLVLQARSSSTSTLAR